ncbi:MAG: NAD-dependent epimerase/dehydratase family protein [Proteobacteria bacterium]|nr:NAD-dependent epimerase/dehydratase family protein [Pseudomonadota bacterium]
MATAAPTLVTGATGFVGSAVARALAARGHTLRLLVRATSDRRNIAGLEAELAVGDLTDPASLAAAAAGCRYVVHVAADYRIWVPDPAAMQAANVDGTVAMLRAAAAAGAERIVYCSSVAALGLTRDGSPANEATPVDPANIVSIYKQSKYQAEQAARALARQGLPVVIVNPAAPVGPRDIKPTPTGRMILDAAAGRTPAYVDTGLNLVHVDDVAEGHVLALERGRIGESYILGGENLTLRAVLTLVAAAAGRAPPRIRVPIAAVWPAALAMELGARLFGTEPRVTRDYLRMARKKMFYASDKAVAELGYAPRPVREAIADSLAWFQAAGMLARLTRRSGA